MRWLILLLILAAAPLRAQETVVPGLSTENIALTANFNGSELFVFGAVRRDAPIPPDAGPLDIIITIKGPPSSVKVRYKQRRFGIWVNTDSVRVREVPSFYAIASTRPLKEIITETERLRYSIGMDQAVRRVGGSSVTEGNTEAFADAVVRIRERKGLYAQKDEGVALAQDTLFQARFDLPANLVEGDYVAEFFLIRDKRVINRGSTTITVEKAGVERWLYNLSKDEPLLYGILAVALALAAGWLAAAAFRLIRR